LENNLFDDLRVSVDDWRSLTKRQRRELGKTLFSIVNDAIRDFIVAYGAEIWRKDFIKPAMLDGMERTVRTQTRSVVRGFVDFPEFFASEESMRVIGDCVLRQVLETLHRWLEMGNPSRKAASYVLDRIDAIELRNAVSAKVESTLALEEAST
jgi:hypothetical protein